MSASNAHSRTFTSIIDSFKNPQTSCKHRSEICIPDIWDKSSTCIRWNSKFISKFNFMINSLTWSVKPSQVPPQVHKVLPFDQMQIGRLFENKMSSELWSNKSPGDPVSRPIRWPENRRIGFRRNISSSSLGGSLFESSGRLSGCRKGGNDSFELGSEIKSFVARRTWSQCRRMSGTYLINGPGRQMCRLLYCSVHYLSTWSCSVRCCAYYSTSWITSQKKVKVLWQQRSGKWRVRGNQVQGTDVQLICILFKTSSHWMFSFKWLYNQRNHVTSLATTGLVD